MAAYVLTYDPVANNKANSNKNGKSVPDVSVESMVGSRDQQTKLDLCFHDVKKCKTLSNKDKLILREWILHSPKELGKSKKITLDNIKG